MTRSSSNAGRAVLLSCWVVCVVAPLVKAAELKKQTAAAFDHYISASEGRINSELHDGPFLFIDALPETRRADAYRQLRDGKILVKQMNANEEAHPIEVTQGLVHDWIGVLFIPNASLSEVLTIVQDYDNHKVMYKPEVRQSKLLNRDGDHFKVFFQLYKKSVATVVINANFDINFERLGINRATSRSYSTRLAEVEKLGQADERELPVGDGRGYLWRLYGYWRFEEKDGGVFIQFESIGLSRTIPAVIRWLVNPLLKSVPRGTLSSLLGATRAAVISLGTNNRSGKAHTVQGVWLATGHAPSLYRRLAW